MRICSVHEHFYSVMRLINFDNSIVSTRFVFFFFFIFFLSEKLIRRVNRMTSNFNVFVQFTIDVLRIWLVVNKANDYLKKKFPILLGHVSLAYFPRRSFEFHSIIKRKKEKKYERHFLLYRSTLALKRSWRTKMLRVNNCEYIYIFSLR